MPTYFARTLRSVRQAGPPARLGAGIVATTLAAVWVGWFFFSRTYIYAVSNRARVEVTQDVYQVQSAVSGVITQTRLELGNKVAKGDVLVVLDSTQQLLELQSERARLAGAKRKLQAIDRELAARLHALGAFQKANSRSVNVARTKMWAAAVAKKYAAKKDSMMGNLEHAKVVSRLEALGSQSALDQQKAELGVAYAETSSAKASATSSELDREAQVADLEGQRDDAQSEIRIRTATCKELEYEIKRRTIRAATSGVLANVVTLTPGATLAANQVVASIVPKSSYRLVAYFPAASAVGRIRPGDRARVRLDAFPWVQFGAMDARVSEVATEAQNGFVRSELRITGHDSRIKLSHGLAGTVEVQTEAVSPAWLVLRTAGYWIAGQSPQPLPTPSPAGSDSAEHVE